MRTLCLALTMLVGISVTNAQITLTSASSTPQVGQTFNYFVSPNPSFEFRQSGANQVWDFSTAGGVATPFNYIDPSSASDGGSFPDATIAEVVEVGENYFSGSSSEYVLEGQSAAGIFRAIYTDKREFLEFPITYNDVFNETFSGTMTLIPASQTLNRGGTLQIIADGYGDLILPYGTVNNVLRIKSSYDYSDSFIGFPVASYKDTIYAWYNAGTNNIIASVSVSYINGGFAIAQANYLAESDLVIGTAIENTVGTSELLDVYPNPAENFISINSDQNSPIQIIDSKGLILKTIDAYTNGTPIDISDLTPGLYFVRQISDKFSYGEKLIVR